MKKVVLVAAVVALVAASLVAAEAAPAQRSASATPPRVWASKVCTSVSVWQKQLTRRAAALSAMSGTNLPSLKKQLVGFLSGVVKDTNVLIGAVDRAGTPSIPHGSAIRTGFRKGLVQTRNYFALDVKKAKGLSTSDPSKFLTGATSLGKALDRQGSAIGRTFGALEKRYGSSQLSTAMAPIAACSALK